MFSAGGGVKSCTKRMITVKPVLSGHSKEDPEKGFKTDNRLMQVKSIVECSRGAFFSTFDLHEDIIWGSRHLFCLFLSGRLRQVSLY